MKLFSRQLGFLLCRIFCLLCLLALAGCGWEPVGHRPVRVSLDAHHPWDEEGTEIWYTLIWNNGETLVRRHMNAGKETVISVPLGKTCVICAFPLGELAPYAGAWTPRSGGSTVVLSQTQGALGDFLLSLVKQDAIVIEAMDYPAVAAVATEKCGDVRMLDLEKFGLALLNGTLSEASFSRKEEKIVVLHDVPSGRWVSETGSDKPLWIGMGMPVPHMSLGAGKYRYYCASLRIELDIVVEEGVPNASIMLKPRYL